MGLAPILTDRGTMAPMSWLHASCKAPPPAGRIDCIRGWGGNEGVVEGLLLPRFTCRLSTVALFVVSNLRLLLVIVGSG